MSWNPQPNIGVATWYGNQTLATTRQLISTTQGLVNDINDLNISTISQVSTITATQWISTPILNTSTIIGVDLTLSSFLSTNTMQTNIVLVSSIAMKGFDKLVDLDVSFDFGLGQAIGGVVGGLGALVGGGLIAAGTGVGLAIQGAETGIATMIAPRGDNFINNNQFETINFTTQLQFSTLGNAAPYYSSILRTVQSSGQPNTVPGSTIYTSTIFPAGTACVRSISDPFNLITGDSNLNASTIQSFGQWCPLGGLEPEDIVANSISTNTISSGNISTGLLNVQQLQIMDYGATLLFPTGATTVADLQAYNQFLYLQANNGFIFTQPKTSVENASLYLGLNGNESLLNVSSIFSRGYIQGYEGYFSTLTVETLNVVSSVFIQSTSIENITSTTTLIADTGYIQEAYISSISSFTFNTGLGNPTGPFDITKNDYILSSTYLATSSLTQNILSYNLTEVVNDQTSFNLNIAETPFGVNYQLTPQNVTQWASTLMIFNDYQNPGGVLLPVASNFSSISMTGTFDIQTQYNPNTPNYYASFAVQQTWIPGSEFSTFSTFLQLSGPNPPSPPPVGTWRFWIGDTGWISNVQFNPAPYATSNDATFTITQDINDVFITASDRLNLKAGEIVLNGALNLTTLNVQNLYTQNSYDNNTYVSTLFPQRIVQSNGFWGSNVPPPPFPPNLYEVDYKVYIGGVNSLASTTTQIMNTAVAGNINNYTSVISTVVNRPTVNIGMGGGNQLVLSSLGAIYLNGGPYGAGGNWSYGTVVVEPVDGTSQVRVDNYNGYVLNGAIQPVLNLSNNSAFPISTNIAGIPANKNLAANTGTTLVWNGIKWSSALPYTPWPQPYVITDSFEINQSYLNTQFVTNNATFTGNMTVGSNYGTLQVNGPTQIAGQLTVATAQGYAGIEIYTQTETTVNYSFVGGSGATWTSTSVNIMSRGAGYYLASEWTAVPSFNNYQTPDYSTQLNGFSATVVNQTVGGQTVLAIQRIIDIIHVGPPSSSTPIIITVTLYPKNLTT